jgi:DNA-binding NtrC family response regulator
MKRRREALRQRAFHTVVSDQRLVDADKKNIQGILLLDDVKALQDGTQVIIVTGYPTIKAAKDALLGRHAFDYLLKNPEEGGPFGHVDYINLVKAATDKAAHLRESRLLWSSHYQIQSLTLHIQTWQNVYFLRIKHLTRARKIPAWYLRGYSTPSNRLLSTWARIGEQLHMVRVTY